MRRLLIATGNQGKIAEFRALIATDAVEIVSLHDVGVESPEETGTTFEENAVLKARHAAIASGLVAVADDSGVVVDALGGAPGVISARYSGPDATDASNRELLLRRLETSGALDRSARFECVIAVAHPDGRVETFDGTLEGTIASEERGTGGFGYDPIFELRDGKTVAELSGDQKNRISHRAMALQKALPYIHSVLDADA
ncbi:MAG TPA: RdgB/HAM1 family non-canonical purine NTP pyrophosphatase [Thermomicrobiales bacterium]|nr:RdgB/HAM1 family non-canonical purine NTP pyrophosphatase [Thermomicrobiales bacterium]